jgi:hypothetical protein
MSRSRFLLPAIVWPPFETAALSVQAWPSMVRAEIG